MRKPAVVVTVAMSAVVAGGIMVATTAGAETRPDLPGFPPNFAGAPQFPGLPQPGMFPGVPGDAGQDDDDEDEPPAQRGHKTRPGDDDHPRPAKKKVTPAPARTTAKPVAAVRGKQPPKDRVTLTNNNAQRGATVKQAPAGDPKGSMQQQALDLVNRSRRRGGCGPLTVDRRLIQAANRHASDMARRGYFAHESPNGERAGERVEDQGYEWSRYGENIARGQDSVAQVINGWMHSPEHRENIMDCELTQVGLGLAFANDRTAYWVQDFATPQ
jgi:uncharacterized protein YkwD